VTRAFVRPARSAALALALVAGACGGSGAPASSPPGGGGGPGGAAGESAAGPAEARPVVATEDVRGSFAVPCAYSHSVDADPIVHPGHEGMGHLHDFFGATEVDAHSTPETLLAGGTTCRSVDDKTSYWVPQLRSGGEAVVPTEVVAYYRVPVGADATAVEPLPDGLAMIAGESTATTAQGLDVVRWSCGSTGEPSPVPVACPVPGAPLRLELRFPACWDGTNLDSADHRSHVARPDDGACPASHPVTIPEVTMEVRYPQVPSPAPLTLASGPPTGGHGDVLVAWTGDLLESEVATCLHRNLRCDVP
jgi:hypothetical protein